MAPTGQSTASPAPRRTLWGLLLIFCSLWIGFAAGLSIGGHLCIPAGSGLAGPTIALGYGALGALVGIVLAGFLAWRLPGRALRVAALVALLLSVLVVLVLFL